MLTQNWHYYRAMWVNGEKIKLMRELKKLDGGDFYELEKQARAHHYLYKTANSRSGDLADWYEICQFYNPAYRPNKKRG